MATIDSRLLFVTTSPRSPEKMIPEIALLAAQFVGKEWNNVTQRAYMEALRNEDFFHGDGTHDPAFSARDRINRGPKSLGFVRLKPTLSLTPAGEKLLTSSMPGDVLLRQMLKFQIPSPFHRLSKKAASFNVKPFLEILRLVRVLGKLRFDELRIFGLQLVDWRDFDRIVQKIHDFRVARKQYAGSYREFVMQYLLEELREIYSEQIKQGKLKTRENSEVSLLKFLKTKASNTRDYADACFRYLRATGLIEISYVGRSMKIVSERINEVDYILDTVSRDPVDFADEESYISYLGDTSFPILLTDNHEYISSRISSDFPGMKFDANLDAEKLRNLYASLLVKRRNKIMECEIERLKTYACYRDIEDVFNGIVNKTLFDSPLMLEWNVWRSMTMLDGGNIVANLKFDDEGRPMCTAQGNVPDILCDYGTFNVCVEVTMQAGQRQFETEHESVLRHLGKMKKVTGKPCYALFVAPTINPACISYFYSMHQVNLSLYGGKSVMVPMTLEMFRQLLAMSYSGKRILTPQDIKTIFELSVRIAEESENEIIWYDRLCKEILLLLSA